MDHTPPPMEPRDVVIDIKSSVGMIAETGSPDVSDSEIGSVDSLTVCGMVMTVDELTKDMNSTSLSSNLQGSGKEPKKGKCSPHSCKKPSKPPRPPRGLSLDAADVKLIQEITELAKMKRARIERMKALKKMKTGKASSSSHSTPSSNWIAMLFTILFCVVIILQGCHPSRMKPTDSSAAVIQDSATLNEAKESYIIQEQLSFSSSNMPLLRLESRGYVDSSAAGIQDSATLNGAKESNIIQEQLSFSSSNIPLLRLESPGLKESLPSSDGVKATS